ncbi:hypothetical protein AVEN_53353-1 [Araneus ventricosus]|uniref:RNase III domain-containing protein n=1 Tax=Araneus ventricosus TaxID=182803 RepID=A0A4Y2A9Y6_ARAVE|nr:hypothetical protein AVEN_53353-1 [Araneus ventricosus]
MSTACLQLLFWDYFIILKFGTCHRKKCSRILWARTFMVRCSRRLHLCAIKSSFTRNFKPCSIRRDQWYSSKMIFHFGMQVACKIRKADVIKPMPQKYHHRTRLSPSLVSSLKRELEKLEFYGDSTANSIVGERSPLHEQKVSVECAVNVAS